MDKHFATTSFGFEGYRITHYYGVVRGITVRSRGVVGNIGAGLQSLVGGNISIYTDLCETAREEAFQRMMEHVEATSANAVIGVRYDANEVSPGITEVICYGTAVTVEQL